MMTGKEERRPGGSVTVRRQKIRKDYTKARLILFLILAGILILTAIFARQLCPYDPNLQDLSSALQPPGPAHWMGTDRYGRDMLSRVIMGSRVSILSTLVLVAVITLSGSFAGILCGYLGGRADTVLMRISDVCMAFPGMIFALAVAAVLKGGVVNAVIALALISWPKYARVSRGRTLALKNAPFVQASRLAGSGPLRIIGSHILPNAAGQILVTAMLDIGTMMMELAGLSYLNLGAQPPTAEWGSMMSSGRSMLQTYPWTVLSPGLGIFLAVVVFNLLGDAVRDHMDPKSGKRPDPKRPGHDIKKGRKKEE